MNKVINKVIPWNEIQNWFGNNIFRKDKHLDIPSYPIILMFKIHLLQQRYNLSDRETEFQITDRIKL